MATILKPKDFSPGLREAIYRIIPSGSGEVKVSILDEKGNVMGVKRFPGEGEHSVNVSPYMRAMADIAPCELQECGIIAVPGRMLTSKIEVEGSVWATPHSAGICEIRNEGEMTDAPKARRIAHGEQDEIQILAESGRISAEISLRGNDGGEVRLEIGSASYVNDQIAVVIVNTEHISTLLKATGRQLKEFKSFTVAVSNNGIVKHEVHYTLMPHKCNSSRLCWWNKYGAVDYFTFENTGDSCYKISKRAAVIDGKRRTTVATREKYTEIAAGFSCKERNEWVAQAAGSPKVWLAEGGEFIPVEIVSDKITTGSDSANSIGLTIRYSGIETFQNL